MLTSQRSVVRDRELAAGAAGAATHVHGREAAAAEPDPIGRRAHLSQDEFRRNYLEPRCPVVFTDLADGWPIRARSTPDDFRRIYGNHMVHLLGQECRLAELIDWLEGSNAEKPGPYPCKFEIARDFRELLVDVVPRFPHSLPDRQESALIPSALFDGVNNLEIFFGGPGGRFPYLHYDVMHLHAWITQLHGEKEFTLYSPDQVDLLYPRSDLPWQSAIRNHHNPDFERYPLFRRARAQRVVIHEGETLFLPCGWWHTARSLTMTISVAFDQLGPDNWSDFVADVVAQARRSGKSVKGFVLGAYLCVVDTVFRVSEQFGAHRSPVWGKR